MYGQAGPSASELGAELRVGSAAGVGLLANLALGAVARAELREVRQTIYGMD